MILKLKRKTWWQASLLLALTFSFLVTSCKDDEMEDAESTVYDPGKPVTISDFTPESGSAKTQVIIHGTNFGTDTTLVKVRIGGKKAPLVGLQSNKIYCMVPQKAFEGSIELTVGDQTVKAEKKFGYQREMVVSTLYGRTREDKTYDVVNGKFEDSFTNYYGVAEPTWFSFNPNDSTELYLAQDNGKPIRIFNLEKREVRDGLTTGDISANRMRTISWTATGDTMIVACDDGGETDNDEDRRSNVYVTKNAQGEFRVANLLAAGRQCNGSAVHPKNGELYYNNYSKGELYRFDYKKWGVGKEASMAHREFIGSIQDNRWEFNIVCHPSGDYAYLVIISQHYIMRMNYDHKKKTFGIPYLVAGMAGQSGWVDGVGSSARLSTPYQGVFVKNPEYVKENKEDVYDFYFCDRMNQCIRILTPDGVVTTWAGRGSTSVNGDAHGLINGTLRDEARFDQPCALAYDERNNIFYVGDVSNHVIRKIAMEEDDEANGSTSGTDAEEGDESTEQAKNE